MVRHGLNHSFPAPTVPMRACTPSLATSAALYVKSAGTCAWYVWSCCYALHTVASSAAAFLSSITASGNPFTKSTMSGRRVCCPSATVNWLRASQSLLEGSSKSITRACEPGECGVFDDGFGEGGHADSSGRFCVVVTAGFPPLAPNWRNGTVDSLPILRLSARFAAELPISAAVALRTIV